MASMENFDPASIIPVKTPVFQVTGGQVYQLLPETTAAQVKMDDGISVETRVNTLERAFSGTSRLHIAQSIAERDALVGNGLQAGDQVYVTDASADETVESGGAQYLFMTDGSFLKVAESESLDVVCTWEHIQDKPESAVTQIDLAVAQRHAHDNAGILAKLAESATGTLAYNGQPVSKDEVWVCRVDSLADIPPNLADGGLVFVNATPESNESEDEV